MKEKKKTKHKDHAIRRARHKKGKRKGKEKDGEKDKLLSTYLVGLDL